MGVFIMHLALTIIISLVAAASSDILAKGIKKDTRLIRDFKDQEAKSISVHAFGYAHQLKKSRHIVVRKRLYKIVGILLIVAADIIAVIYVADL